MSQEIILEAIKTILETTKQNKHSISRQARDTHQYKYYNSYPIKHTKTPIRL